MHHLNSIGTKFAEDPAQAERHRAQGTNWRSGGGATTRTAAAGRPATASEELGSHKYVYQSSTHTRTHTHTLTYIIKILEGIWSGSTRWQCQPHRTAWSAFQYLL